MAGSLCLLGCSFLAPEGKWEIMLFATINSDFYRPTSILMLDGLRGIRCCFPLSFIKFWFPTVLIPSCFDGLYSDKGRKECLKSKTPFFFLSDYFPPLSTSASWHLGFS